MKAHYRVHGPFCRYSVQPAANPDYSRCACYCVWYVHRPRGHRQHWYISFLFHPSPVCIHTSSPPCPCRLCSISSQLLRSIGKLPCRCPPPTPFPYHSPPCPPGTYCDTVQATWILRYLFLGQGVPCLWVPSLPCSGSSLSTMSPTTLCRARVGTISNCPSFSSLSLV